MLAIWWQIRRQRREIDTGRAYALEPPLFLLLLWTFAVPTQFVYMHTLKEWRRHCKPQSASAYLTVMQPSSLSISAAAASRSESGWDGVGLRPEDPRLDLNALE